MLPTAIRMRKNFRIAPGAWNDPVTKLFHQLDLTKEEWHRYEHWNPDKAYTRNLVATDNKTFTLMLLCWNPDQHSPIHDHQCDACQMQVMQGTIREQRYQQVQGHSTSASSTVMNASDPLHHQPQHHHYHHRYQQQQQQQHVMYDDLQQVGTSNQSEDDHEQVLERIADLTFGEGQLAHITDSMGYHSVGNPSCTIPAVTLHLYSPPIAQCQTWASTSCQPQLNDCADKYDTRFGDVPDLGDDIVAGLRDDDVHSGDSDSDDLSEEWKRVA